MALRTAIHAAALGPILTLAACGGETSETEGQVPQVEQPEQAEATAAQTARGGDAVSSGGETVRGPQIEAVAQRFNLTEADAIILPTLYRATADISSTGLTVDPRQGDLDYISVSGSVDPDAVLQQPRRGLAFELTTDRVTQFLDQPVIITLIARVGEDWDGTGERPSLRAAWVEPSGANSGWRAMNLTNEWQKTVFTYDAPSETAGTHIVVIAPPSDRAVDIAALAVRASGVADLPDPGGD